METKRWNPVGGSLSTGELAERAGVNRQTLRYYERRGLLPPPPRTDAGYRQYPPSSLSRILFIKRAQDLGFTLDEIDELLSLRVRSGERCDDVRQRAVRRRRGIDRKIAQLLRLRDVLDKLIGRCEAERETPDCPILEALEGQERVDE